MNPTEYLTYPERMARIGQLLSKGITLLLIEEAEEKRRAAVAQQAESQSDSGQGGQQSGQPAGPEIADETEREIFDYLKRVGKASPRDVMRALEIPKATAFRKLARLTQANLVMRSGKTTAIRYKLAELGQTATPTKFEERFTVTAEASN